MLTKINLSPTTRPKRRDYSWSRSWRQLVGDQLINGLREDEEWGFLTWQFVYDDKGAYRCKWSRTDTGIEKEGFHRDYEGNSGVRISLRRKTMRRRHSELVELWLNRPLTQLCYWQSEIKWRFVLLLYGGISAVNKAGDRERYQTYRASLCLVLCKKQNDQCFNMLKCPGADLDRYLRASAMYTGTDQAVKKEVFQILQYGLN